MKANFPLSPLGGRNVRILLRPSRRIRPSPVSLYGRTQGIGFVGLPTLEGRGDQPPGGFSPSGGRRPGEGLKGEEW